MSLTKEFSVKVLKKEDHACTLLLRFEENLIYFDGHFPSAKILPGIAQVKCALDQAGAYLGTKEKKIKSIEKIKFKTPIFPNEEITLTMSYSSEKKQVNYEYQKADQVASSGLIRFR